MMQSNIIGILGILSSQAFDMNITTFRENLGQPMASAMTYGYFLHTVEQRMALKKTLPQLEL